MGKLSNPANLQQQGPGNLANLDDETKLDFFIYKAVGGYFGEQKGIKPDYEQWGNFGWMNHTDRMLKLLELFRGDP